MPLTYTESDLNAVGRIQQDRGCTIENAKAVYRKYILKLANPDADNRAELVLASISRGVQASDEEVEASIAPKRVAKKVTAKKEPKAKKVAKPKAERKRIDWPITKPEKEVELTESDVPHVYTASLFGKKYATIWAELDHATQGADSRFGPIPISQVRLSAAKSYGKENDLPIAVCVTVRVGGRLDQGYAIPVALFEKFEAGKKKQLSLSGAARKAYSENGWDGVRFTEKKVEEKAA